MPTGMRQTLAAQIEGLQAKGKALAALAETAGGYTDEQRAERDDILHQIADLKGDLAAVEAQDAAFMALESEPIEEPTAAPQTPKLFGSLGEQLIAIREAAVNPRAADPRLFEINAATGASETIGHDGGFLVQTDFQAELMRRAYGGSKLIGRTDQRTVGPNANGVTYNVVDETSRVAGSRGGGVTAYWVAEGASITASRPKLAQRTLKLGKLVGLYYATDELLQDATALESWVTSEFTDEFAFMIDDAIVRGTGAGIPEGILNADCLVTVAKESGQAADTVVAENLYKMFSRLHANSVGNAVWLINQDVWPQIFSLNAAVGTGGVPLFIPAGGITDSPAGTLLGRPIVPIEQAATLGDAGDIILADLGQYLTINKGGIQAAQSIHVAFTTDEQAFRWTLRMNGKAKWLSALTPYKGSATKSPFVNLAARA